MHSAVLNLLTICVKHLRLIVLSRQAKELLKGIASFGEKQFHETGAAAVEVLRVKASTIRKHFRKLKGIAYLVSVISLDRVRIYFFNTTGMMLFAENIEPILYSKIRKTSKLIIKFEKPRPPTEEELRIEATEELRTEFSKAIRRVARILKQKEPSFPNLFVSREKLSNNTQGFGFFLAEDGTMIFEEQAIESNYAEGLNIRAALLLLLELEQAQLPFSQCLGNSLAYSLLKEPAKAAWLKAWITNTSEVFLRSFLIHFIRHSITYLEEGYHRFLTILKETPPINQLEKWYEGLRIIHDSLEVPLGTEEYQVIRQFYKILKKPQKLTHSNISLDSIHLYPRVVCDPTPLGLTLSLSEENYSTNLNGWFSITYLEGSEKKSIIMSEKGNDKVTSLDYILQIEDLFPKPSGIVAHGKDFIRWAKKAMDLTTNNESTFQARIEFTGTVLTPDEKAVLERLTEGSSDIIKNSLIGSPNRITSLIKKGKLIFLPNFQHLGIFPNYLVIGNYDSLYSGVKDYSLESTILNTQESAFGIVSAPTHWASNMLEYSLKENLGVYPIVQVRSNRQIIRCESIFPSDLEIEEWMASHQ